MHDVSIDERALCAAEQIGAGTRIAAFAQVLPGARIGAGCEIANGAFVAGGVTIGDRVSIGPRVYLHDGISLADDISVGANATFAGEPPAPTPQQRPAGGDLRSVVGTGASIGANATIAAGIEVGRGANVGAGAVVTRSVPPNAIVVGNPAHIVGYTGSPQADTSHEEIAASGPGTIPLPVAGARLTRFSEVSDLRGSLTAGEVPREAIPFAPTRWFLVYDVPNQEVRGEHAHYLCHQFLICVAGSMAVAVDDGHKRAEITLDSPTLGLYVPPLIWASQFRYTADAVLLVLASHHYDPGDYIRDYELFLGAATH